MRRIALILTALAAILLSAGPARAQDQPGGAAPQTALEAAQLRVSEDLPRLTRVLNRVRTQLTEPGLSLAVFDQLRQTVSDVQQRLVEMRAPVAAEAARLRRYVESLGPPPKEGEPAEPGDVAQERRDLNARLAEAEGRLKQIELLLEEGRGLLSSISRAERTDLETRLLVRTPSLLSAKTWSRSLGEISVLLDRAGLDLRTWAGSTELRDAAHSGFFHAAFAALLVSAALGWLLRRWLIARFGRKREIAEPTFRMRVLAVLAESGARTVIPILMAVATLAMLHAADLMFGLFEQIATGFVLAVVVLSLLYGLPQSMLSPSMPQWRLAALGDYAARLWCRYAIVLAVVVAFDLAIAVPAAELQPSQALTTTYTFVVDGAYALIFFLIATDGRLWRLPGEESLAGDAGQTQPAAPGPVESRSRWWLVVRTLIAIIALAIPATALGGYSAFSDFIARRLLATVGVFLVALVLHGLVRDLVAVFTLEEDKPEPRGDESSPFYVWSVLFLDIGLVLTTIFLIVPLWGGHWASIVDRLDWSFSGFRIGDHVFSITDVLAGMVAFVVGIAVVRSIQHFISRRILQHTRMDTGVRDSLVTGIGYVGLAIAAIIAVTTAGIDLSGLAIVAGALSVGIGFGLQSVVNNFVSGLILLAERPIKVGDWVEVGPHHGIVKRISVRSTEIKTFSRASVIVPNSELISSSVVNWVHKDKTGRVEIKVGVGYDSDVEQVESILLKCAHEHPAVQGPPDPRALFQNFGENALLFELRCIVKEVDRRHIVSSELRFAITKAFREAGISIPFPQRDLHIKDADGLFASGSAGNGRRAPAKKGAQSRRKSARAPG